MIKCQTEKFIAELKRVWCSKCGKPLWANDERVIIWYSDLWSHEEKGPSWIFVTYQVTKNVTTYKGVFGIGLQLLKRDVSLRN